MAEPAHSAAGPGPESDPERKPDPRASGWGDVRCTVMLESQAIRLSVEDTGRAVEKLMCVLEELGRAVPDPGKLDAAVEELRRTRQMNEVNIGVMRHALTIAGRCRADEAVIENERARAFDEGVEWCKAQRCRMEVIDGGRQD